MTSRPDHAARGEAPAKVNLGLRVGGRRDDGLHLLNSVFLRLALHDDLEVRPRATGERDELVVAGDPSVPVEGNLVLRAVAALRAALEREPGVPAMAMPSLNIRLTKRIPAAAGLGGASSDAATVLRLALKAWDLPDGAQAGLELAQALGADVPFFVADHGAARVTGIGEVVRGLPEPKPPVGILLVTPADRLATGAVFAEHDRAPLDESSHGTADSAALDDLERELRDGADGHALAASAARLRAANDLWAAAARLRPGLVALRDDLESRLTRALLMSGSGPTLLGVLPSPEAAAEAAAGLRERPLRSLGHAIIISTSTSQGGAS